MMAITYYREPVRIVVLKGRVNYWFKMNNYTS
ncbi:hypothetical protein SAMN05443144_11391 [Fodinibius roseus]|uniref:Uncharacterized protein n=1 Tax=Fodinibius roseus TaxID=1194090 RepID=A0A1M5EKW0_9BACT|nr:hypothetical protein SAMN05443144_11391 [Fodinibius roseus]